MINMKLSTKSHIHYMCGFFDLELTGFTPDILYYHRANGIVNGPFLTAPGVISDAFLTPL